RPRDLGAGALHHARQRHRGAAVALALVGRLHEREQLDRLLGADRRLAGAEELADLDHERLVAAGAAGLPDALGAEHRRPVARLAAADAAERADAAVLPGARHQLVILRLRPR